jgi:hypothetical protein
MTGARSRALSDSLCPGRGIAVGIYALDVAVAVEHVPALLLWVLAPMPAPPGVEEQVHARGVRHCREPIARESELRPIVVATAEGREGRGLARQRKDRPLGLVESVVRRDSGPRTRN